MNKNDKMTFLLMAFFIFIIGGFMIWTVSKAEASENNNSSIILNVPSGNDDGTALALAASQHRYKISPDVQGSAGLGYYNETGAVSLGFAAMDDNVLFNGSIGITEHGTVGAGAAVGWSF